MARARFSIGIDLGTTNSALAFAPLVGEAAPEILLVPQWESLAGLAEERTLPSFLYLPEDAVAAHFRATRSIGAGQWIIGRFARAKRYSGWEMKPERMSCFRSFRIDRRLNQCWPD